MKLLDLVESTSREGSIKVVPDLLQFIALRARLDLDGVPVINLNDVPLQGVSAFIKRALDVAISAVAPFIMAGPGLVISWLIKRSSPGPVFYTQERMGLDGNQFDVYSSARCRSMGTGDGPGVGGTKTIRAPPASAPGCASTTSTSGRNSGTCWSAMSIVVRVPNGPSFVEQFKLHRIPQYMLRNAVLELLDEEGPFGTRTDDRHVADQHVPELRPLVEVVLAQPRAEPGGARDWGLLGSLLSTLPRRLGDARLTDLMDEIGVLPRPSIESPSPTASWIVSPTRTRPKTLPNRSGQIGCHAACYTKGLRRPACAYAR